MNHIQKNAVLGIAALLLLAGCSAPAPGGGSGSGDSGSSNSDSSNSDSGSADDGLDGFEGVPANFPDDVPIISGDVPAGIDLGTGWSVVVQVDDLDAAFAEASGKLTTAGFEELQSSSSDEGSFGVFQNDKYQVQVTATDTADYGLAVAYVVVLRG
ncbi:MAG: hypothetical protein KKH51_00815 [Actinobacteria bacterium]|nr:hypothetical protein [Actinomycetota bacterium]